MHAIHLTDDEWQSIKDSDSVIAHCPTSNLFLGSVLFSLEKAEKLNIRVGIGSDVGGGTTLNLLSTLNEAYKVQSLQGETLAALKPMYMLTLGGARALSLESYIGSFETGKEADFIILDYAVSKVQKLRYQNAKNLNDQLFSLMMLGDERNVRASCIM